MRAEESTMAPTRNELLAVPTLGYTLTNEVIDRCDAILNIKRAALAK